MKIVLTTARMILREFVESDAETLFALDSDPEVVRYVGLSVPTELAPYQTLIRERYLPYYQRYPAYGYWAALERASNEFLGWFHLRPAQDYRFAREAGYRPGDVDLGYRFRRAVWGRGYASEGAQALVRRALTTEDAARVVACAFVTNRGSLRVMEKAGLRLEAQIALSEFETPALVYALTREEFARAGR